jgi:hypothetical protein
MYFNYTIDELADEPIMLIDKHIGIDEAGNIGVLGDQFANELLALDGMGKKRIQVWINSVGGNVMDGMNIYNAILRTKTKVDTYNVGVAASTAGWIFLAGRKRYMNDYAILMMHKPYLESGTEDRGLEAFTNSITTMISNRCSKSYDEVSNMMSEESWLNADECMQYGMCDEITKSGDMNKRRLSSMSARDAWSYANKILNSSLNKTKMIKVTNKLGLVQDASEDSVCEAISAIENKAAEVKNNLEAAIEENEALKARIAKMENENAAVEATAKEAQADVLVNEAVEAGKVENKAEVIATWKNQAIANFEATKSMLDSIAVNKTAVIIETSNATKTDGMPTSAASLMAQLINKHKKNNK